ncbi:MAG: penicillin-binding protein activator LpoB [Planctomycetaceae bacterium]|nr:penicillin-binding protein activator LpoB [Planctomycetaceae bacterium]
MLTRRQLLRNAAPFAALLVGCRNVQHAKVLTSQDEDMVGSHAAGTETWQPLIQESVGKLLGRQVGQIQLTGNEVPHSRKKICFVGIENKSAEDLGDFKEQIYQHIDTLINESEAFEPINRRYVDAGLQQCGLRADQLFIANNQRMFAASMERFDQPFDYLLYATITSGTTQSNKDYQRDYLLTLELIDIYSGNTEKESAEIRKGYRRGPLARLKS